MGVDKVKKKMGGGGGSGDGVGGVVKTRLGKKVTRFGENHFSRRWRGAF